MKKSLSIFLILMLVLVMFSGCRAGEQPDDMSISDSVTADDESIPQNSEENAESKDSSETDVSKMDTEMFTERDRAVEYDVSEAVTIRLNGTSATSSSESVQINGSKVTIKEEATYIISGSLTDGMIIVDATDTAKLQLVFDGAEITAKTSAALYIKEADKVFLTLAEGKTNSLANGGTFTAIDESNIDGALFSKQDLTLNGSGSLSVTSPGGHGIVCKDDLVITGGNYAVNTASHGLDANDSVRIANANFNIDAGKDAIHCENSEDTAKGFIYISSGTITGEAEGDGIAAGAYLEIAGGMIDLLVGGGSENGTKESSGSFGGFMGGEKPGHMNFGSTTTEDGSTSMKGLKAATGMVISDGNITINSADDSIHSDASLTIKGGAFSIASGDDAIHAEETLTITAGKIDISESYEGLEALHIDVQGGDIKLTADDDGLNAAGGTDQSGTQGGRDGMFGRGPGGMGGGKPGGGEFGGMSSNSNGSIKVSGGTLYIQSSGDGLDANGTLEISGGYTIVVGPTRGDTATLDYDKTGVITGGTFIGTGSNMMAQSFSDSTQGVIALNAGNCSAGTEIILKNSDDKTLISRTPELDFAVLILSSPEVVKGETYTVKIGSNSGEFKAT